MTVLGKKFPTLIKQQFSEKKIIPGSVFRFQVPDTVPPKIKIIILLAISNSDYCVGNIYINTEINNNIFKTPSLRSLHVKIKHCDHDFLDHDSFVDCSSIHEISSDELNGKILNDPSVFVGSIPDLFLGQLIDIAKTAPTIPVKQKKKFSLI